MSRFKPKSEIEHSEINKVVKNTMKKYPFQDLYAVAENDMIYINMETIEGLNSSMECIRDIALIIDLSGSMFPHYKNGDVATLSKQIVDTLIQYDDDGIDLYFFASDLIHHQVITHADQVDQAIQTAIQAKGAYGSTMPTSSFRKFCEQMKQKGRAGTVLFLTDGIMDDAGKELKEFYTNYLHTQFKTRDIFYCYAIEFGRMAFNALSELDGLYEPEQGPEDLFDMEKSENINDIAQVLKQVAGMSAIGSNTVSVSASVDSNAVIDMVNADLIENGMISIEGLINKVMSFRVRTQNPFILTLSIKGYDTMKIQVTPRGVEVDLTIL